MQSLLAAFALALQQFPLLICLYVAVLRCYMSFAAHGASELTLMLTASDTVTAFTVQECDSATPCAQSC